MQFGQRIGDPHPEQMNGVVFSCAIGQPEPLPPFFSAAIPLVTKTFALSQLGEHPTSV